MEKILLSKLLSHHELLRSIPAASEHDAVKLRGLSCSITGALYTSHETAIADNLAELIEKFKGQQPTFDIIHDSDQDGNAAAYIMKHFLDVDCSITPKLYEIGHGPSFKSNVLKMVKSGELYGQVVFVLDQSFNAEIYDYLSISYKHVVWIDHHILTSENDIKVQPEHDIFVINPTFSAAGWVHRIVSSIRGRYCDPRERYVLETVAYLTHFHDTWQYGKGDGPLHEHVSTQARQFAAWFDLEIKSRKMLEALIYTSTDTTESMKMFSSICQMGEAIICSRKMIHSRILKEFIQFFEWNLDGVVYKIAAVMHSDARSVLCEEILKSYKDIGVNTAMVVFYSTRDQKMRVSVRGTDDGPPVNPICEHLGGAGHRNSAGFGVPPEVIGGYLQDRVFKSVKEENNG